VAGGLRLYVFADLFAATGRAPATRDLAGSWIVGAGLDFSWILKS